MPKHLLILSLLLTLAVGCKREADDDMPGQTPVAFAARLDGEEATRAGVIDNDKLASMGVFASYTGQSDWTTSSTSNFMYNQPVEKPTDTWTYTPMKYWPNTEGDKLSFFAYAPHADKMAGLTTDGYNSSTATGYPKFRYEPPVDITKQTDLLFAPPLLNKTKGSELSFTMGHVLTHVLFKVKSTSNMTVSKLTVNKGAQLGYLSYDESGYSWTSINGNQAFSYAESTDVPENTLTDICESFLLPRNAESVTLTFTEDGSNTEQTETIALPSSPVWAMNKTVAYTIGVENKTKITLSVKEWQTGTVNGTIGEEPSGNYPFTKNGIIYESATKCYLVGPTSTACEWGYSIDADKNPQKGWYQWHSAIRICRGFYSFNSYGSAQWRLPNIKELTNIVRLQNPGSSYWSITDAGNGTAYKSRGVVVPETAPYSNGHRLICIRDMGDMTYPTVRVENGFSVVYRDAAKVYMRQQGRGDWLNYDAAVKYCQDLRQGNYSDWRLPDRGEAELLGDFNLLGSTHWSTTNSSKGKYTVCRDYTGGYVNDVTTSEANGRPICVRDY